MAIIKPVGSKILVTVPEQKEEKLDGIFVPGNIRKDGVIQATVVAIGNKDIPDEVRVESVVLVSYLERQIISDGKKFYLLNIEDVLAVLQ